MDCTFALVEAHLLKPHESLRPDLLEETQEAIAREGLLRRPLLVERSHYIILDGHHRFEALRRLGCTRVPAYLVDYFEDAIRVETWPGAAVDRVRKEEVIDRARRGNLFPPKTTRHVLSVPLRELPVKLEALR